jgi:hypothetical protein
LLNSLTLMNRIEIEDMFIELRKHDSLLDK